jgi:hypothetical protein
MEEKAESKKRMEELSREVQGLRREQLQKDKEMAQLREAARSKDELLLKQQTSMANLQLSLTKTKLEADCAARSLSLSGQQQQSALEGQVQSLHLSLQNLHSQTYTLRTQLRHSHKQTKQKKLSLWAEFRQVENELNHLRKIR